jgi:hypothetical protein
MRSGSDPQLLMLTSVSIEELIPLDHPIILTAEATGCGSANSIVASKGADDRNQPSCRSAQYPQVDLSY